MKINVGIVGYGNLGRAIEKEILKNKNFNLVAIFSRRVVSSNFNSLVEPYENHILYKHKIDIMFLCGGSLSDIESQAPEITKHFNTINSFDTHSKIKQLQETLNKIATKTNHISIISCGWDPGIFSNIRALMYAVSGETPITFWGKGISMGHSDAIRRVNGVDDGVQFTVPNKQAIALAKKGILSNDVPLHFRECFIVSHDTNKSAIEKNIKNIPNYFKNQPTTVAFVNVEQLLKLKKKLYHKGEIICSFGTEFKSRFEFKVQMQSNPNFTAKIMLCYAKAVINLKKRKINGGFTPLDIPFNFLFLDNEKNTLNRLC